MTRRGWVPALEPFARLQREMDHLFESVFGKVYGDAGRLRPGGVYPPMNVRETDGAFVVECEVPGLEMDNLEVYVTGDQLTVSGRRNTGVPEENVTLHRRERDAGPFSRALTLASPVQGDKAEASLTDGILAIRVPKAEAAKPKRIAVKAQA